ncbi:hypothetical protein [Leptospira haakeii]|uniref:RiboL-PSP-HEPN domain-containing protein n=1 Tax=Leptospira haakeii TaxID=2023198 RepID=A0ABX4PK88_9LEPT|nr:hypothetical protein [Leptospira haakeii]PKA15458.1 hypothetical protein CH363_12645 [Leptospira haakeii]PKA18361.1 hypothetical protein CH377_18065 [Leptospira haakeii]
MALSQNLLDFRNSITELNSHIQFAHQKYANGVYKITNNLRVFISESAFLKMFVAWETFVESSFIDYLINEESVLLKRPAKWATPIDRKHANQIIIGNQKYMDWSNPEIVRSVSKIFFHQGYVFDIALSAINADLMDMKTIRNSAAHLSSTTSDKLDGLATRILGTTCSNYTAYKLLFATDPRSVPIPQNVLERYLTLIDIAAEQIANG